MSKLKLPIIIALVAVAGGAGLFMSGIIGGKEEGVSKKYVVPSVPLAEPFIVNTSDAGADGFLKVGIAVQLEPMDELAYGNFTGANAGGHGGGAAPGPEKLAVYPKFRDAVIETAATYPMAELRSVAGKARFKRDLLDRFAKIAEVDEAAHKAAPVDPTHEGVEPPYHVSDIFFTDFAVQDR